MPINGMQTITAIAPVWLTRRYTPGLPSHGAPPWAAPSDRSWLNRFAAGLLPARGVAFAPTRYPVPAAGIGGAYAPQAAGTAAAGVRAAVSAQGQLATYSSWVRGPEGRQYLQWRESQLLLPEAARTTGTWGKAAGVSGVLRGNAPHVAWRKYAAGQVWNFRCNIFATNHTYLAGFSLPVPTRPDDMRTRYLAEVAGRRHPPDNQSISRYFDRVAVEDIRPGDWVLCGKVKDGRMQFRHVVLATGGWQGNTLGIAQAGSNPMPDRTTLIQQNGRFRSAGPSGRGGVVYEEIFVLRPKRLRPTGPDGRPVSDPHS